VLFALSWCLVFIIVMACLSWMWHDAIHPTFSRTAIRAVGTRIEDVVPEEFAGRRGGGASKEQIDSQRVWRYDTSDGSYVVRSVVSYGTILIVKRAFVQKLRHLSRKFQAKRAASSSRLQPCLSYSMPGSVAEPQ
jgi:hypothetical protein